MMCIGLVKSCQLVDQLLHKTCQPQTLWPYLPCVLQAASVGQHVTDMQASCTVIIVYYIQSDRLDSVRFPSFL